MFVRLTSGNGGINTVNSEIFARFYFRETSHMQSSVKIKLSQYGDSEIILSFTNIGKSCPSRKFLTSLICLLTLFTKNNILVKIFEFTVIV